MSVGPGGPFGPVGQSGQVAELGAFFALNVLPTIIFFSSLMAVLYHMGVMQFIVRIVAVAMQKTMGTSASETLSASGNIFVGQTEAPLLVRPFVKGMTQSELMAVMTGGFATVAGVMAAYVGFLEGRFTGIAGHLLSASVMSAPAALVCAKLMIPEDHPEKSETYGTIKADLEKIDTNVIDAAARGAGDGLKLALNVAAMLLAFIALIALANSVIGGLGGLVGFEGLTLETILGYVMLHSLGLWVCHGAMRPPLASFWASRQWSMNSSPTWVYRASSKMAQSRIRAPLSSLFMRSAASPTLVPLPYRLAASAALRSPVAKTLAKLGLRAMIAGTIACMITATVAGLLI